MPNSAQSFFHLLGLIFVPSLAIAGWIVFSLEGLIAPRLGRPARVLVAIAAGPLYAVTAYLVGTLLFGRLYFPPFEWSVLWAMVRNLMVPTSAGSVFGFWLPTIAVGVFCFRSESRKWWAATLVGFGALFVGVLIWILAGIVTGAPTD